MPKGFRKELVKRFAKIDKDIKSGRAAKRMNAVKRMNTEEK